MICTNASTPPKKKLGKRFLTSRSAPRHFNGSCLFWDCGLAWALHKIPACEVGLLVQTNEMKCDFDWTSSSQLAINCFKSCHYIPTKNDDILKGMFFMKLQMWPAKGPTISAIFHQCPTLYEHNSIHRIVTTNAASWLFCTVYHITLSDLKHGQNDVFDV